LLTHDCIDDIFLVDTNVWLWQTYPNATVNLKQSRKKQINVYLNYLPRVLSIGAILTYSGLSLAELASVIERKEFDIYQKAINPSLKLKEYRHNLPNERAKVVNAVQIAWIQVQGLAVPVDLQVNDITTNAALRRFQSQCLDGYDLLILEAISRSDPGQIKVITDDSDYVTVPGIQVFTYNQASITAARNSGKLIIR
jgi:hypothetical protein